MVNEEKKKASPLLFLIIGIIIGLGCCCVGFYIGGKINEKEDTKTEEKEKNEVEPIEEEPEEPEEKPNETEEPEKLSDKELEKLVNPYLTLLSRNCSSKESFYITQDTKYENMHDRDKLEIAYIVAEQQYDIFDEEFEAEKLIKGLKYAFGKDKEIELPEVLDIESGYAGYSLQDDKYVLEAQGGGCIVFDDFIHTKIVDSTYNDDELTVIVNFVYVVRDNNLSNLSDYTGIEEDKVTSKIYNNHSKKRLIQSDVKYLTEDETIKKVLTSDKTDHIEFTFVKENDHYIFKKAELVER